MTSIDLDRVFGHGRLRMVTGEHVEVFREEAAAGERRRYTKRFLCTTEGDFRHWTEREWRILARLVGHGAAAVPEVLRFERGTRGQPSMVQTYDAGITVDHWTTLLPVRRDRRVLRHVFEDCAHWWALAFHALRALDEIHALQLVHLDLKADNICIPIAPADFDPCVAGQVLRPEFDQLALIDFAFSLISGEPLAGALPIGHQVDHGYQSPRLLHALEAGRRGDLGPTRQLDWRCDIYSLAAMLRRYLPDAVHAAAGAWTQRRLSHAHALVDRLFDAHHRPVRTERPHRALMDHAASALADEGLADSLARGWALAGEVVLPHVDSPTPVTRIALPVSAPAVDGPAGAASAQSGGAWLRTVPQWPMDGEPPRPSSQPVSFTRGSRGPVHRASSWAWLPGLLASAAGGVALVLPAVLGPAQRDASLVDATLAAPRQTDELTAALAAAAPEAQPPVPGAGQGGPASSPAAGTGAPARADLNENELRVSQAHPGEAARSATLDAAATPRTPALPAPRSNGNARPDQHDKSEAFAARHPIRTPKAAPAAATARPSPRAAPGESSRLAAAPKTGREATTRRAEATKRAGIAAAPARIARAPAAETRTAATHRVSSTPQASIAAAPQKPRSVVAQVQRPSAPAAHEGKGEGEPAAHETPAVVVSTLPPVPEPMQGAAPSFAPDAPAVLEDFTARAETFIAHELPRLAQRAERLVLRVLHAASISPAGGPDAQVLNAAMAMQRMVDDALAALSTAAEDARRLHEAAAAAFWNSRDPARALRLELRAFGADPRDPEVAGALAFYQLKQRPVQAEAARRLALLALALPQPGAPHGRIEDWTTFAVASALAGRERDARNAWLVTLSLGPVERQCRAAVAAYASHGALVRASVEAMLARVREAGRSTESPFCRWPPNWWAGAKAG